MNRSVSHGTPVVRDFIVPNVERLVFAHEQILDSLRTHDAIKARLWMAKHVVDFRRGYELANLDVTQPFTLTANWAADD
jgi:hypothetical protein